MIFIDPEEAQNYRCCSMDKACDGPACMAWKWAVREVQAKERFPAPPAWEKTGKGYCALTG